MAFLDKVETYRRVTDKWAIYEIGTPPSNSADEPDFLMPFWDLITPIKVYCTQEARRRAELTVEILGRYVGSDGLSEEVGSELEAAVNAYIEQVRIDLGIQPARPDRSQPIRRLPESIEPARDDEPGTGQVGRDSAA